MNAVKDQFVINETGQRTAALLGIDRYLELLKAEEELACVRAYDEAKATHDEVLPFAQAIREIEAGQV